MSFYKVYAAITVKITTFGKDFRLQDQIQGTFTHQSFLDILKVLHGTFLSYFILHFTTHSHNLTSWPHPCGTPKELCKIWRAVKRQSVFLKDTSRRRSLCGHTICCIWPTQGNWKGRNTFRFIAHSHSADKNKIMKLI